MKDSRKRIEAGAIGNDIWIGRSHGFYGTVNWFNGDQTHYLRFSVEEAKVAVKMLNAEIERAETKETEQCTSK